MSLGAALRVHRPVLVGGILGIVAVSICALILWLLTGIGEAPGGVILVALGFTGLAVVLLVSLVRDANTEIVAHEHGIAWTRSGEKHSLHFDDIKRVHELSASLVIQRRGGKPITLPAKVTDRDALTAHLQRDKKPA